MNKKLNTLKKDFIQLIEAKETETKKASIKMIQLKTLMFNLLANGEQLNGEMLNALYYHLREDYINAVKERKNLERQTIKINTYIQEHGAI